MENYKHLQQQTGWSDAIFQAINSEEEARIYMEAGLVEKKRESEIDRQQFEHEKAAHWMARYEDFEE